MHANYRYMIHFALHEARLKKTARILDFGCGSGEVVAELQSLRVDAYGADIFYPDPKARAEAEATGLMGQRIFEIHDQHLPFKNEFFDIVICNQVFEHVEELSPALFEIHRVLKRGGKLLSLFPTAEVMREGHISIPFVHWFRRDSSLRYLFARAMRSLGLGSHKSAYTVDEWVQLKLDWLDRWMERMSRTPLASVAYHRLFGIALLSTKHRLPVVEFSRANHRQLAY